MSRSDLAQSLKSGDRAALARAITLVESRKPEHQREAQELLLKLMPEAGRAIRIGITGVPGVGKSTFIDTFGSLLTKAGHKAAVLAVDPSSGRWGGSILGDKTRMPNLATDERAFIRPSPTSGTLGGVARATREAIALCEAAGYDVVIVETVGVGQSETAVANMVDFFLVLMLPGAGDELQGIKKGILEVADMLAVNKADGDNKARATAAARDYRAALHILTPASPNWSPPVVTCSAVTGEGLEIIWARICEFREKMTVSGEWGAKRKAQAVRWMWSLVEDRLLTDLKSRSDMRKIIPKTEKAVEKGELTPVLAAEKLLKAFYAKG